MSALSVPSALAGRAVGRPPSAQARRGADLDCPVLHRHSYKGTSDLQLERISVYYNEATGQSPSTLTSTRCRVR